VNDLAVRDSPSSPADVVLFPQEVLASTIFEPRYRMMLSTVLETIRLFRGGALGPPGKRKWPALAAAPRSCDVQTRMRSSNIVTMAAALRGARVVRERTVSGCRQMVSGIEDRPAASDNSLRELAGEK